MTSSQVCNVGERGGSVSNDTRCNDAILAYLELHVTRRPDQDGDTMDARGL